MIAAVAAAEQTAAVCAIFPFLGRRQQQQQQ